MIKIFLLFLSFFAEAAEFQYHEETFRCLDSSGFVGTNKNGSLRCKDFSQKIISNIDFSKKDLRGANFHGATLINVNFKRAQLDGACFENATMDKIDFKEASLRRTDFTRSLVRNSVFTKKLIHRFHQEHLFFANGNTLPESYEIRNHRLFLKGNNKIYLRVQKAKDEISRHRQNIIALNQKDLPEKRKKIFFHQNKIQELRKFIELQTLSLTADSSEPLKARLNPSSDP